MEKLEKLIRVFRNILSNLTHNFEVQITEFLKKIVKTTLLMNHLWIKDQFLMK